jgi:hypothetical protein
MFFLVCLLSIVLLLREGKQLRNRNSNRVSTVHASKAIPVTGLGGLQGCEMLRIPHCLDNRLTVNCEILATCSSTYSPVRTSLETQYISVL